jgi:hypothetical protein
MATDTILAKDSVVTTEVSKPSAKRQNRHVPDVCRSLGVQSCGPFQLNKDLGFRTQWRLTALSSERT